MVQQNIAGTTHFRGSGNALSIRSISSEVTGLRSCILCTGSSPSQIRNIGRRSEFSICSVKRSPTSRASPRDRIHRINARRSCTMLICHAIHTQNTVKTTNCVRRLNRNQRLGFSSIPTSYPSELATRTPLVRPAAVRPTTFR